MKALITGSNGFLGSALVERLIDHGCNDIRCLVRQGSRISKLHTLSQNNSNVNLEFCVGNLISIEDAKKAVDGVDVVYHLAASLRGAPADIFLNTVVASKNLLEAMSDKKDIKAILVSSFGVYGTSGLPQNSLIDENTPLETHPEKRDIYSHAKLRQELLFREYQNKHGFSLAIARPGVIYGPGGSALSTRIGINLFGVFLHFGRNNLLPLSYIDNCAEAIAIMGTRHEAGLQVVNIHDDDLPTSKMYLQQYTQQVKNIRCITFPYWAILLLSLMVKRYHSFSKGQLPDILTPYKSACLWKGFRFTNQKLKSLGWKQLVSTPEGMIRTFDYFRSQT